MKSGERIAFSTATFMLLVASLALTFSQNAGGQETSPPEIYGSSEIFNAHWFEYCSELKIGYDLIIGVEGSTITGERETWFNECKDVANSCEDIVACVENCSKDYLFKRVELEKFRVNLIERCGRDHLVSILEEEGGNKERIDLIKSYTAELVRSDSVLLDCYSIIGSSLTDIKNITNVVTKEIYTLVTPIDVRNAEKGCFTPNKEDYSQADIKFKEDSDALELKLLAAAKRNRIIKWLLSIGLLGWIFYSYNRKGYLWKAFEKLKKYKIVRKFLELIGPYTRKLSSKLNKSRRYQYFMKFVRGR